MVLSIRFILVMMVILHLTPKLGFLLYTHIITSISRRSIHSILSNAVYLRAVILGGVTTK